jgi:hypothetical protein
MLKGWGVWRRWTNDNGLPEQENADVLTALATSFHLGERKSRRAMIAENVGKSFHRFFAHRLKTDGASARVRALHAAFPRSKMSSPPRVMPHRRQPAIRKQKPGLADLTAFGLMPFTRPSVISDGISLSDKEA